MSKKDNSYNFRGRRPLTRDIDVTLERIDGLISDSLRQRIDETSRALKYLPFVRSEKGEEKEFPDHIQIRPYKHAKSGEIYYHMEFTFGEGAGRSVLKHDVSLRSLDRQLRRLYEQLP